MTPPARRGPRDAWHLVSGEYPPGGGGVGEYTRLLARALAEAGREVHVWAPAAGDGDEGPGVRVHAVPGFGRAGGARLDAGLDAFVPPRRILVQYAPQAFGMRGMNVAFCRRVLARARGGDEVRVLFHEPFVPFGWPLRRNLLALANRWMASLLLRAGTAANPS